MAETIVLRWSGPPDAAAGSRYRVERTLDWSAWSELAGAQAATQSGGSYVDPVSTLASDVSYGAATIALANAGSFAASGYLWLDAALVQWASKSGNSLQGCAWHSGYGTFAAGTPATQAHESYTDAAVSPTNGAVIYRITHIDPTDKQSAPTYCTYWYPPYPASSKHCVLIAAVGYDVGVDPQAGVAVKCALAKDDEFSQSNGLHLDKGRSEANTQVTNALGLAFFQCWKSSARRAKGGGNPAPYALTYNTAAEPQEVSVPTVPDRDWLVVGLDVGE